MIEILEINNISDQQKEKISLALLLDLRRMSLRSFLSKKKVPKRTELYKKLTANLYDSEYWQAYSNEIDRSNQSWEVRKEIAERYGVLIERDKLNSLREILNYFELKELIEYFHKDQSYSRLEDVLEREQLNGVEIIFKVTVEDKQSPSYNGNVETDDVNIEEEITGGIQFGTCK